MDRTTSKEVDVSLHYWEVGSSKSQFYLIDLQNRALDISEINARHPFFGLTMTFD